MPDGSIGNWIRPIWDNRKTAKEEKQELLRLAEKVGIELTQDKLATKGRTIPDGPIPVEVAKNFSVLDIIDIPIKEKFPHLHQTENYVVNETKDWKPVEKLNKERLYECLDKIDGSLWQDKASSYKDRVSEYFINNISNSLYLIKLDKIEITKNNGYRGIFKLNDIGYNLKITDRSFTFRYYKKNICDITLENIVICVSLGGLFLPEGARCKSAFKLIASIIEL